MNSNEHVFITTDFPPMRGGVARYYDEITSRWKLPRMTVFAPASSKKNHEHLRTVRPLSIHVRLLYPHWIWAGIRIFAYLLVHRPVVVHVGQVLPVGTFVYAISRILRIPYVVYIHGMDVLMAHRSNRKWKIASCVIQNANALIVNSGFTESLVRSMIKEVPPITIAHPGRTIFPMPSHNVVENLNSRYHLLQTFVLLTVSRLVERKGIDRMIEALVHLPAPVRQHLRYVVIGSGPDRKRIEDLMQRHQLTQQILLIGEASDAELAAWYERCDVCCLVSRATPDDVEGFGMVLIEAAGFGKPAIAGNTGGIPEAVVNGKTGILVDPEDPQAIANAIQRISTDRDLYTQMSQHARDYATHFSWDQTTRKIEKALERL
ncbi:MAG: glycosyltransferase family 4 protein [Candidatus Kerfeldbacteria bacterium]|nr:glycosyltransferase family 4 protein [Candidatus Kerfeldbacteria bacterium]